MVTVGSEQGFTLIGYRGGKVRYIRETGIDYTVKHSADINRCTEGGLGNANLIGTTQTIIYLKLAECIRVGHELVNYNLAGPLIKSASIQADYFKSGDIIAVRIRGQAACHVFTIGSSDPHYQVIGSDTIFGKYLDLLDKTITRTAPTFSNQLINSTVILAAGQYLFLDIKF